MSRPFTVVIPTIGRETLARTLESIDPRLASVIVVADTHGPLLSDVEKIAREYDASYADLDAGAHDTGSPQLHLGYQLAGGTYVMSCGDDDVYEPDAFETILSAMGDHPAMFKVVLYPNEQRGNTTPAELWSEPAIERFKVTGQGFVTPNVKPTMGRWVDDVTFMRETVALHGGRIDWREEVIARCY